MESLRVLCLSFWFMPIILVHRYARDAWKVWKTLNSTFYHKSEFYFLTFSVVGLWFSFRLPYNPRPIKNLAQRTIFEFGHDRSTVENMSFTLRMPSSLSPCRRLSVTFTWNIPPRHKYYHKLDIIIDSELMKQNLIPTAQYKYNK